MKKLILMGSLVAISFMASAQEKKKFEVKNFDGVVWITAPADKISIQAYDGNNVIIEAEQISQNAVPEKAAGLKMVTSAGVDNTGMSATVKESKTPLVVRTDKDGASVTEEVRVLEIALTNTKNMFKNYVIKLPRNVNVVFKEDSRNWMNSENGTISFSGFSSELDIFCSNCFIDVSDFRGNLIANNTFGKGLKVEFSELSQERVTSIRSGQGDVEVIFPASTKANLRLSAGEGNVFTDFDLEKAAVKDTWVVGRVLSKSLSSSSSAESGQGVVIATGKPLAQVALEAKKESATTSKSRFNVETTSKLNTDVYDYTINGGGVYVSVNSTFGGNIFLKKK